MNPIQYEKYCANQLKLEGWEAELTSATGDQGADIIAENEASHEESNPCSNFNVEVEFSSIFGIRGGPIPKYNYEISNLVQEINTVINSYKKSFALFEEVIKL